MRGGGQRLDLALYVQTLPVLARNLGVLAPVLAGSAIAIGLDYAAGPLLDAVGSFGAGLLGFAGNIVAGFAFAVSVIFADDAWRHSRASLPAAWSTAQRKAGDILLVVIGFYFILSVAGLIGGILPIPYSSLLVQLLALWAFIYSIPAVSMGGIPAGGAFSVSIQTARRYPLPTTILAAVCLIVYYALAVAVPMQIAPYLGVGYAVARLLLNAFAFGYVALVTARAYADLAFRGPW